MSFLFIFSMKKFISNITVATLAFLPMVASAQTPGPGILNLQNEGSKVTKGVYGSDINNQTIYTNYIVNIINWVLGFLGIAAVILIIYGGILWMTSMGDDKGAKKGKEVIMNAVIGLAIILGAYVIVNFVITALIKVTVQ